MKIVFVLIDIVAVLEIIVCVAITKVFGMKR